MEEKKDKKKKKLLLVLIPILAAAIATGGIFAAVRFGKGTPEEEGPEETGDSPIWYNVDKDYYYQMTEGGMSGREAEEDGLYHVLMALNGAQKEFLLDKFKTVNVIDNYDFSCFELDETGEKILQVLRPEEKGYMMVYENMYVMDVDSDVLNFNVQENLLGMEASFMPEGEVKVFDLANNAAEVEEGLSFLQKGQRFTAFNKDEVDYIYAFPMKADIHGRIYWNVERQWDTELLATKRKPNADGEYEIELAVDGHVETFKTKKRDIATEIDKFAARNFSLRFDKKGYIVKVVATNTETGGYSLASWHTVIRMLDENGSFFARKTQTTAKDYGNEEDVMFNETTKVYCVNDNFEDHYGEETVPMIGDTVHCVCDSSDNVIIVFVVSRRTDSPVYWNLNRQYDSTLKSTKRVPEADGFYHFTFGVYGEVRELKVKDKEIADLIDSYAALNFAFKVEDDVIVKAWKSAASYVRGLSGGAASWAHMIKFNNAEKTEFHTKKIADGSDKGTEADWKMAEDCRVFNVSTNFTKFKGEETTLMVGDQIHCLKDLEGNIKYIYVINRKTNADIYWNVTRSYNSKTSETSRKPQADGYYHISMTTNGKAPVDLITKDKAIATKIDSYSGRNMGIVLAADGRTIVNVIATASVNGVGGSTASWTDVTAVSATGFTSHKDANSGVSYAGKTFNIKYSGNTKVYNVSGSGSYVGVPDKVQKGDVVHVINDMNDQPIIVYIVTRPIRADIYWNVTRKYDSTTQETTRTPDANGYYQIEMTTGGKAPQMLQTLDKAIATKIDAYSGRNMGIKLAADGKTIEVVYGTATVKGYTGGSTASWTDVTSADANGFTSHKAEDSGVSYAGQNYTIKYEPTTKIYNVTTFFEGEGPHFVGEPTTVRKGDMVHVILDDNKKPAIVFVVARGVAEEDHKNTHLCDGCGETVTWQPWLKNDSLPVSGHYYLCADVNVSGTAHVGDDAHLSLCLNGHTVASKNTRIYYGDGVNSVIALHDCTKEGEMKLLTYGDGEGAGLIAWGRYGDVYANGINIDLTDITTKGNGSAFYTAKDRVLSLKDVTIKGGASTRVGGSIGCVDDSIVTLENVSITGATGLNGDMIYVAPKAKVTVKGTLKFLDIYQCAIYMANGAKLTLDGLTETKNVVVKLASGTGVFTTNVEEGAETKFISADPAYTVNLGDGSGLFIGTEPEPHEHCICGGIGAIGDHTECDEVEWTEVKTADELYALTSTAAAEKTDTYVYLANDITLSKVINIYTNHYLHICLNGYTLKGGTSSRVFSLYNGKPAGLSITDCSEAQTGTVEARGVYGSATNTLQGHIALLYNAGSTMEIYGGTLQNGHLASHSGGAINAGANTVLKMYGGTIKDSTAEDQKGSASYGYGGNVLIETTATFHLYGGTITGGTAAKNGDNVYVKGTLIVGGTPVVNDEGKSNIALANTAKVQLADDGLKPGAKLGITLENPDMTFLPSETDCSAFLVCDDGETDVTYDATEQVHKIGVGGHVHCVCADAGEIGDHTECNPAKWTAVATETELKEALSTDLDSTTEVYVFLANDIALESTIAIGKNVHAFLCLDGYTLTAPKDKRAITVNGSGEVGRNVELSITDCSEEETGEITAHADTTKGIAYCGGNLLVYTEGVLNLYAGTVSNGMAGDSGGNVSVQNGNPSANKVVFNMYGGTIKDGKPVKAGGNVYINKGTFNMYGGTISGGVASTFGGNIHAMGGSTVTIKGGEIKDGLANGMETGSTSSYGGNISLTDTDSVLTIEGGEISGGKVAGGTATRYGANVCLSGASKSYIKGGVIKDGAPASAADTRLNGANVAVIGTKAELTIDGGEMSGGTCYNGANLAIIGGSAKVIINDTVMKTGTSTNNGYNIFANGGTLTINGGIFDKKAGGAGQGIDNAAAGSTTIINGGTFNCYVTAIRGIVTVNGGLFRDSVACLTTNTHTLNLLGGKFVKQPDATCTLGAGYSIKNISETLDGATYLFEVSK